MHVAYIMNCITQTEGGLVDATVDRFDMILSHKHKILANFCKRLKIFFNSVEAKHENAVLKPLRNHDWTASK